MPETIKIASFIPGHTSEKSGKFVPAKLKDGNDREFAIPKELVDFVSAHQGQTVEIDFTEKVNGQWTNRNLTSAKLPEPPKPASSSQGNGGWRRDPEEGRLIVRQSSLKAAVDFLNGKPVSTKEVLSVAETFTAWVYGQVVVGSSIAATTPIPPAKKTTLQPGQSIAEAVAEVLQDHDPLEDPNPPHPADTITVPSTRTPYPRETLRASGPARR